MNIFTRLKDWFSREEKLRFARIVHQKNIQIDYLRQRFEAEESAKLEIKKYSDRRIKELALELDKIERRNVHAVKIDDSHKKLRSDLHHAHNTISQIRRENEKIKQQLAIKNGGYQVCQVCNPHLAEEVFYFNENGGIIKK